MTEMIAEIAVIETTEDLNLEEIEGMLEKLIAESRF